MTALKTHAQERVFFSAHADLNLLPGKFRKQMKNAVPFLITNQDTTTNTYQITFTADSWEGVGSAADWVSGYFIYEKSGTEEATVREMLLPRIYDPALGKYRAMNVSLAGVNKDGVHAGIIERASVASTSAQGGAAAAAAAPAAPTTGPGAVLPIRFMPVDILRGFDPPMAGDTNDDGKADNDKDDPDRWVWWTSVARVPTAGGGPDGDLNQQQMKVVFNSDDMAKRYELRIIDGADLIELGAETGTVAGAPTKLNITAKDAKFKITGKDPSGKTGRQVAIVGVFLKDSTEVMARLKVRVLPPIILKLAVWIADDPAHPETAVVASVNAVQILARANKAFRQACVVFEPVTVPAIHPSFFGLGLWDGIQLSAGAMTKSEAQVNLVMIRGTGALGVTLPNEQYLSVIETKSIENTPSADALTAFKLTCAHEIGHQLGLSTRFAGASSLSGDGNHDKGRFPNRANDFTLPNKAEEVVKGLMAKSTFGADVGVAASDWKEWMRNEDWLKANEIADKKKLKLPWVLRSLTP